MRKIAISSGHGLYVRGASGYLDEVDEARRVVDRVYDLLQGAGATAYKFHDDQSHSQSENLNRITDWHNSQSRDLDVSVHFNAYQTTSSPMGTEVLYITQSEIAAQISAAIATAGHFKNRGAKYRSDLHFLNATNEPAVLVETCFVDSSADANLYRTNFEAICRALAETAAEVRLDGPVDPGGPPVEPPSAVPVVDIAIHATGAVTVRINGQPVTVEPPPVDPVNPIDPEEPIILHWQHNIETTVFSDHNTAYPPFGPVGDKVGCSLPWKWTSEPRPKIIVRNRANGSQTICEILDVGPWMVDDDYWTGNNRPVAEQCFLSGQALPSGPNAGKVPTNAAGLDLSPAAAAEIGLDGKGYCEWAFTPDVVA